MTGLGPGAALDPSKIVETARRLDVAVIVIVAHVCLGVEVEQEVSVEPGKEVKLSTTIEIQVEAEVEAKNGSGNVVTKSTAVREKGIANVALPDITDREGVMMMTVYLQSLLPRIGRIL